MPQYGLAGLMGIVFDIGALFLTVVGLFLTVGLPYRTDPGGTTIREIDRDSAQKRVQRRDAARQADIPDDMLAAWGRLSPEQRQAYVEMITSADRAEDRSDAKKPAPKGRRKRTED